MNRRRLYPHGLKWPHGSNRGEVTLVLVIAAAPTARARQRHQHIVRKPIRARSGVAVDWLKPSQRGSGLFID